ncbi:MAG TPA: alpha/beta hydrolase-fold protein [Solirubrobacteraceae bacterium]|nr:alpha/beta hydrolase-fold protein [Solirubrobacteraceae bacterium]
MSANGSFAFATKIASGGAYKVTVKTTPSGQRCSVANGSGTVGSADVTNVAVTCAAIPSQSGADDFNRSDGGLGANWTAMNDGGLSIKSQQVTGPTAGTYAGDIRTAAGESYASDQYSQITVTANSVGVGTGGEGEWVGPSVRSQNGGQDTYLGMYFYNSGSPQLRLYRRNAGAWTQLGGNVNSGVLPAGTQLTLSAVGSQISLLEDGVAQITVTDTTLTGGAPGIMTYDAATADDWSGGDPATLPPPASYSVGGTTSGVSGTLVLQDNGGDDLNVSANGSFTFPTKIASGGAYNVTVKSSPSGESCSVSNGSGTIGSANVTNVAVTCVLLPPATYSVGGTATGVSGTLVLQDNGGDDLNVSANGSFTIPTKIVSGGAYNVTVKSSPSGESCSVSNGSGTNGSANVTNVAVTCVLLPPATYSVGGTATGVSGTLVLQDNGGDDLNVSANGSFTFPTKIASGGAYNVTVKSSPSGETCSVSNGSGTIGAGNVTNVTVTCVTSQPPPNSYSIGGAVSGLSGIVVLQDNGGDDLNVGANGSFTFPTKIATGATYRVTVASNPAGQTCTVAGGSGTVGSANVTTVTVTCAAASSQVGADDFNRADANDLGAGWTAMGDGGLAIKSQQVIGTAAAAYAGDIRTAAGESYGSDQYSQIVLTANSVGIGTGGGGGEWVGPSVRSQNGGQDTYLGMYFYNGGSPQLRLYVRNGGTWTQLGGNVSSGVLPAGTQLTLTAVGSRISLAENGVAQITVTDTTLTGGAPGIMTYDAATADTWSGGNADALPPPEKMQVQFDHTSGGVDYYNVISSDDGGGAQVLRVVNPTNPAPGVPHNFLFALPVEPGTQTTYGDGIATLQQLNAQNQYNVTVIEPSFGAEPWYADNPTDPGLQYETFMSDDLVPWAVKNLATSGDEQNWLLGFSKSGFGAQDLILKHPGVFTVAASWDFPADMDSYTSDQGRYVGDGVDYGTDANFQANYRLTASFVNAHKAPFQNANRLWIGGYQVFQSDVADYDALLTSDGMKHTTETPPQLMAHRWDSGWVQIALSALNAEAAALPRGP